MEFLEVVDKRFSCRSYKDKDVKEEDLKVILENAIKAPNAGNIQDFRFLVVKNEDKRKEVAEAALDQRWMIQAPVFIVVCSDKRNLDKFYKSKSEVYSIQDCSAVAQNLILTATSLGLSTCWIGAFDEGKVRISLNIPAYAFPYMIITLGYGNEEGKSERLELGNFVYFDGYGSGENPGVGAFPLNKHKGSKWFSRIMDKFKKS